RNRRACPCPHFRTFFHHQGRRQRHRPRTVHHPGHRQEARRRHRRALGGGQGLPVPDNPSYEAAARRDRCRRLRPTPCTTSSSWTTSPPSSMQCGARLIGFLPTCLTPVAAYTASTNRRTRWRACAT